MTYSIGPSILSNTLYLLSTDKHTVPIILEEGDRKYVPRHLDQTSIYVVSFASLPDAESIDDHEVVRLLDNPQYKSLRSLVARLLGQNEIEKPIVAPHPPNLTSKVFLSMYIHL